MRRSSICSPRANTAPQPIVPKTNNDIKKDIKFFTHVLIHPLRPNRNAPEFVGNFNDMWFKLKQSLQGNERRKKIICQFNSPISTKCAFARCFCLLDARCSFSAVVWTSVSQTLLRLPESSSFSSRLSWLANICWMISVDVDSFFIGGLRLCILPSWFICRNRNKHVQPINFSSLCITLESIRS